MSEMLSARIVREREWAVAAWDARLTFQDMRRLSAQPPERGGLGYMLSESALKGLVEQGREARGDLVMGRAERRERQQAEVDARIRAAREDLEAARLEGDYRAIESADRRLDAAQRREAALQGLDEPTRIEADVASHDAVDAELDEMLAKLDATQPGE